MTELEEVDVELMAGVCQFAVRGFLVLFRAFSML